MSEQVLLTGRFTNQHGEEVVVTKKTAVPYRHAVALVSDEGAVVDVRYSKSYSGAEQHDAAIAREWGLWGNGLDRIVHFGMYRPSKFTVCGAFTPEQIALIEAALGQPVKTNEIKNAN